MGINDRHYARALPNERRPGFWRSMTVIHWLIAVNVAVFVVDGLVAARGVIVPVHMGDYYRADVDPRQVHAVYTPLPKQPPRSYLARLPILDRANGRQVGEQVYRWMPPLQAVGHFSTAKGFFGLEVWRFITFQFLHADTSHLLLNMMGLFFFGPLVEQRLRSKRRTWAYYLVCGICGAIMYLSLNLLGYLIGAQIPGLLFEDMHTPLIGASAGVFGVLMASAFIAGDAIMLVFFVLPMKIRTGAYLMVLLALFNLIRGGANAGGDAAHLGGAIAGFFFIRNHHYLRDFFDIFGPSTRNRSAGMRRDEPAGVDRASVDAALDKVRLSGLHSLTDEERELLQRATRQQRGTMD